MAVPVVSLICEDDDDGETDGEYVREDDKTVVSAEPTLQVDARVQPEADECGD